MACKYIYKGTTYNSREEFLEYAKENIIKESSENKFMQLLEKDSNWVTFFIKSIIQDSVNKEYEKVLFPTGNTASKVEGHSTLEEFKKQKEDRLKQIQPDVILPIGTSGSGKSTFIKSLPQENLVVIEPDAMRVEFTGDMNDKSKDKEIYIEAANRAIQAIKQGKQVVFDTTNLTRDKRLPFIEAIKKAIPTANIQYKLMELNPELAKQRIKSQLARGENRANVSDETIDRHAASYKQMLEDIKSEPISNFENNQTEINQLKQELERVEKEGFAALKPIYKFYQIDIRNVLVKNYGEWINIEVLKNKYGKNWKEADLTWQELQDHVKSDTLKFITDEYGNTWIEIDLMGLNNTDVFFAKDETNNFKTKALDFLLKEQLINKRKEKFTNVPGLENGSHLVVKRYAPGSYDYIKNSGIPVIQESIDKILKVNQRFLETKGFEPFKLTEVGPMTVVVTIQEPDALLFKTDNSSEISSEIVMNIASKLQQRLNIPYKIITTEEAYELLKNDKIEYDGKSAFFKDGVCYFTKDNFNEKNVLHEFAHPFILALKKDNPELYNQLLSSILSDQDPKIQHLIKFVEENYPKNQVNDELIVRILTIHGQNLLKNERTKNLLHRFLFYIKQLFRRLFDSHKLEDLSFNTTIEQLAKMLYQDGNFKFEKETSLYALFNKEMVAELEQINNTKLELVNQQIIMFRDTVKAQMKRLWAGGGLYELNQALKTADDGNLLGQVNRLLKSSEEAIMLNNVDLETGKLTAFVQALLHVNLVSEKMKMHTEEVMNNPDKTEVDKLIVLNKYVDFINEWKIVFNEFKTDIKNVPLIAAEINATLDNFKEIEDHTDSIYKKGLVAILSKELLPIKQAVENELKPYLTKLEESYKNNPDSQNWAVRTRIKKLQELIHRLDLTDDKILDYLRGLMGDTNMFSSLLESYTSSPDPIVGGFSVFVQKHLLKVEADIQQLKNRFTSELDPLYKKLKVNRSNPKELASKITYTEIVSKYENGKLVPFEVRSLLNPYANGWMHDKNVKEKEIEDAFQNKDFEKMNQLKEEYDIWLSKYFNREFKENVYEIKRFWNRDAITKKAKEERNKIISILRTFDRNTPMTEEDLLYKEQLELDLRILGSKANLDGSMKDEEGQKIAEAIQEYYQLSKGLYKENEIKGAFNVALESASLLIEIEKGFVKGSPEFEEALNNWIRENIRIKISEKYYKDRQDKIDQIDEILSKIAGDEAKDLLISQKWKDIIEQVRGFRDENGYPIGTELEDSKVNIIKNLQEEILQIREEIRSISGITPAESEELNHLFIKISQGFKLNKAEQSRFNELLDQKDQLGLNAADKAKLFKLFSQLDDMSLRLPTEYYMSTLNEILQQEGFDKLNFSDVDEMYNTSSILHNQLMKNTRIREWFNKNHIARTKWDYETNDLKEVYERLYIWNKIIPAEDAFINLLKTNDYQSILDYNSEYISVKKARKFYYYKIDDIHKIDQIVGLNVDNRGNFLPLSKEQGQTDLKYINQEYYRLKESSDEKDKLLFDTLKVFTKYHLKAQEDVGYHSRLYLELPRMRSQKLENVQEVLDKPVEGLLKIWENIKSTFRSTQNPDDFDTGQASDPKQIILTDILGNQLTQIPVRYMSNLPIDITTYDIGQAILRYASSIQSAKALREIHPIAKALTTVLEKEGIKEVNAISQKSLINRMLNVFPKSKGNVRLKTIQNMIERDFEGIENHMELGLFGNRVAEHLMKIAAFGSMSVNIPGHIKNMISAQIQNSLEAVTKKNITGESLLKASGEFVTSYIPSFIGDYNSMKKGLYTQMFELFDPVQGRFSEHLGKEFGDDVVRDALNLRFFTAGQNFGEIEAQGTAWLAMMKNTFVDVVQPDGTIKKIRYDQVWTLVDNVITTIPGVPEEYQIGGSEFLTFKMKMLKVNELLQGAYAKLNQPELARYTTGKLAQFMRKYFTPGLMNSFAKTRSNVALGDLRTGYLREGLFALADIVTNFGKNFHLMSEAEKRSMYRTLAAAGYSVMFMTLLAMLGFDDDDPDRFKKLKHNSWAHNMLIYEILLIKGESETFLPFPGMGVNELLRIKDSPSLALPMLNKYNAIINDLIDLIRQPFNKNDLIHFKRKTGIYEKGDLQIWAHLLKLAGYTGSTIHPEEAIKGYSQAMNRYK